MFEIGVISKEVEYVNKLNSYWKKQGKEELTLKLYDSFEQATKSDSEIFYICENENLKKEFQHKKVIAFVEDILKEQLPETIAKYQKPDDMYKKLYDICLSKEFIQKDDKNEAFEYAYVGKEKMLLHEIISGGIDCYELGVLNNCPIEGLIPLYPQKDVNKLYYYVHGKITLREFIEKRRTDRQLIQILKDILDTLIRVEDFMLDRNKLILDLDYIYLHQITGKPYLIYFPGNENQVNWIVNYKKLMTQMSEKNICKENNAVQHIQINDNSTIKIKEGLKYNDETEFFEELQNISIKGASHPQENYPSIFWENKDKQIIINKKIFKIGKEKKYVDFCIQDNPAISRTHADILMHNDQMYIIDKGSKNHTYINGILLEPNRRVLLKDGDNIRLANEDFIFHE